ncbi:PMS1 protein 1 [Biomphalaria glabrata]|nr:PMS1 protein 1 [Biomphalaria glabrata]
MANKPLQLLPKSTITLIGSSQVIVSVYSVIKELVENSVDAGATSLDIKLENYGLDKIEVCDNGSGIRSVDVPFLAKRHCTSKINSTDDLKTLQTYGFRGEALASLCEVSEMKVTTKTDNDNISQTYSIDHQGNVTESKPSHIGRGTIITACRLFHNLPVRKQYYASSQRKKDDLNKIEDFLMAFALIKPSLRITFKHDREMIWQKLPSSSLKDALNCVLSRPIASQLLFKEKTVDELKIHVSVYLPKPGSDTKVMSRSSAERTILAVNRRPVIVKELIKVLKQYYNNCHPCGMTRYPVCFVEISVPPSDVDVNVEPNKTTVFIQNMKEVQVCLEEILLEIYGPLDHVPSWHYTSSDDLSQHNHTDHSGQLSKGKNSAALVVSGEFASIKKEMNHHTKLPDKDMLSENNKRKSVNVTAAEELDTTGLFDIEGDLLLVEHSDHESRNNNSKYHTNSASQIEHIASIIGDYPSLSNNSRTYNDSLIPLTTSSVDGKETGVCNIETSETGRASVFSNKKDTVFKDAPCTSSHQEDLTFLHSSDVIDLDLAETKTNTNLSTDSSLSTAEVSSLSTAEVSSLSTAEVANKPSNWSRGDCLMDSGNNLVQPVQLLVSTSSHSFGKHSLDADQNVDCPAKRKRTSLMLDANQTTLDDIFGLNSVTKESPFMENVCLEKRNDNTMKETLRHENKILNENDEAKDIQKLASNKRAESLLQAVKNSKPLKTAKVSVRDQVVAMAAQSQAAKLKKSLKKKTYSKEKTVKFNIDFLRSASQSGDSALCLQSGQKSVTFPALTAIGQLQSCDAWVCGYKNQICIANVHRLSEVFLYRKLKETYRLEAKPCAHPLILDQRCMTETVWSTLKLLAYASRTKETYFSITDERLVANGFNVRCCFDGQLNLNAELGGLCDLIPAYSLNDLYEVLETLNKCPNVSLGHVRPIKVQYYLQGEAVRILKQSMASKSLSDVQAMLDKVQDISESFICLHHRPVFHSLIDLTDNETYH